MARKQTRFFNSAGSLFTARRQGTKLPTKFKATTGESYDGFESSYFDEISLSIGNKFGQIEAYLQVHIRDACNRPQPCADDSRPRPMMCSGPSRMSGNCDASAYGFHLVRYTNE